MEVHTVVGDSSLLGMVTAMTTVLKLAQGLVGIDLQVQGHSCNCQKEYNRQLC